MIWPQHFQFYKVFKVARRPITHTHQSAIAPPCGLKVLIVFWPHPKQWFHSRCFALAVRERPCVEAANVFAENLLVESVFVHHSANLATKTVADAQTSTTVLRSKVRSETVLLSALKTWKEATHMLWLAWIYFALVCCCLCCGFFFSNSLQANDRWPCS